MIITLGALSLNSNLFLDGVDSMRLTTVSISRTILGKTIIQYGPAPAGHELQLISSRNSNRLRGFFLQSEIDAMKVMETTVEQVTLVHPRGTWQVIVNGINVEPVFKVNDHPANCRLTGSIQLLTV